MSTLKPLGAFSLLCVACLTIMVGCVIVPGLTSIASGLGVFGSASWLVTLAPTAIHRRHQWHHTGPIPDRVRTVGLCV